MKVILTIAAIAITMVIYFSTKQCTNSDLSHTPSPVSIIKTDALTGANFSGLYSQITGISGKVPAEVKIDFAKQLQSIWNYKLKNFENKVVDNFYQAEVLKYSPATATKMSLNDYVKVVDQVVEEVNDNLDWTVLSTNLNLSNQEQKLVRDISSQITGNDLISYGLTELMPGVYEGKLNVAVLDWLLRHAGREYIELIPAIHDSYTSFGLWQFTSYAVYETPSESRGASIIAKGLPEKLRVPGSMIKLRGNDHARAAYLFSIYNLCQMVKSLNKKQTQTLSKQWQSNMDDIVKYIATAHNNPRDARKASKCWLDNDTKSDYTQSCGPSIVNYSKKTNFNRHAIYNTSPKQEIAKQTQRQKPESKKQTAMDKSPFTALPHVNSKGERVFKYQVKKGDNLNSIAKNFNRLDKKNGNAFHEVNSKDVCLVTGKTISSKITVGQHVYITAKER